MSNHKEHEEHKETEHGEVSTSDLLACPFCGKSEDLYIFHEPGTINHPWYAVHCDNCGAQGPGSDHGDHLEMWNKRV